MNVRIWSNYIHHTFVHIATAATSMGPLYIFRNVFGESRVSRQDPSGGMMIQTGMNFVTIDGERVSTGLGYRFIFHNTALQPNGALDVFSSRELHNAVSRNNIFDSMMSTPGRHLISGPSRTAGRRFVSGERWARLSAAAMGTAGRPGWVRTTISQLLN
jgi:hypothetical protein